MIKQEWITGLDQAGVDYRTVGVMIVGDEGCDSEWMGS